MVWSILIEGSEDIDELIDIQVGLARLPLPQRTFLVLLSQGYPAAYAMKQAGIKGNSTRWKWEALKQVTRFINGTTSIQEGQ